MIDGVVSMRRRGEDRSECDARCAKLDGIVQPASEVIKAMSDCGVRLRFRLGSHEAEWIYVPQYRVCHPIAHWSLAMFGFKT
jgi:hypothetical protein